MVRCSPDAAQPDAEPAENFPYPAEYAYKPSDDAAPHHSTPTAEEPIIEQEVENFPYPAEYAYHADTMHTTTETEEADGMEEEEDDEPPGGFAGVQPAGSAPPSPPADSVATSAEPAKVTSASYTLEGEPQQHSLTQRLMATVERVTKGVTQTLPDVPPLMYEVLAVYADGWRWLMNALFPRPRTPAEGERTSSRSAAVALARRLVRLVADDLYRAD